jgi:hypothetical protein
MSTFRVDSIQATSDLALYIFTNGRPIAIPTTSRVLWGPNVSPNPIVAFNLSLDRPNIPLRVQCTFGSSFIGRTLTVEGLLNDGVAVSAAVTIRTASTLVQPFVYSDPNRFPLAYRGSFQWRLRQGNTTVATFATRTNLEFYNIFLPRDPRLPAARLWYRTSVSVNLLRIYIPIRNNTTFAWNLAAFYNRIIQDVFRSPFRYNNTSGAPRYVVNGPGPNEDSYRLDQYFRELEANQAQLVTCADMAGIVQVILSLFPDYESVQFTFMSPYGWIRETT